MSKNPGNIPITGDDLADTLCQVAEILARVIVVGGTVLKIVSTLHGLVKGICDEQPSTGLTNRAGGTGDSP